MFKKLLGRFGGNSFYSAEFFARQNPGSRSSAQIIVPLVISAVQPKTVVDVGCGVGTWSSEFLAHSIDAIGIDGDYVRKEDLQIPAERFKPVDLNRPPRAAAIGSFDLAICLEVAEHLTPASAENLVEFLTGLAPNVLFGAAIPGQGGRGHINEQWQSYWISLFTEKGMYCHDIVRPATWSQTAVRPWYSQNTFLFTRDAREDLPSSKLPTNLVHPKIFHSKHWNRSFEKASR